MQFRTASNEQCESRRCVGRGSTRAARRFGLALACCFAVLAGGCPTPDDGGSTDSVELGVEISVPNEGAAHRATGTAISYASNPPASGAHWPVTAAAGFYETPVETERWVHNLEHGYVVVLYDCRGECDPQLLADLESFSTGAPASPTFGFAKVIVTPYDGLAENALLTAVAWDVQLSLDRFDLAVLTDFVSRHQDQGPELAP